MARRRVRVETIKDIIRYRLGSGMGERQVARALKVSRTAVSKYVEAFQASGLELSGLEGMADSALREALQAARPATQSTRVQQLSGRFPTMLAELKKKGMTLQLLWERYLRDCPQGYQYSQFCYHFQRWCDARQPCMHIEHKAGEEMFVDWAGDRLVVLGGARGEEWRLDLFVAILGASELTYVEARESQQEQDWIRANEEALRYFGGSPAAISPDNTKTAVLKIDPYEPGINPVYDDFAKHYGLVIFPARVRKPRDKALVENAVRLVYQRISVHLSGKRFASLQEVNQGIKELLEKHNNRRFQRLPYSRRELFERIERQALRPLPAAGFPLKETRIATVQFNYHVELTEDRHYYSVPHYLRKREEPKTKVKLVYDERVVAIYYDNQRVAQHRRDRTPNGYTTSREHMPPEHRWYAQWSRERFQSWARSLGTDVETLIVKVLDSRPYAPQAFRTCMGILNLQKSYGPEKLNKACRRAWSFGAYSYTRVNNILAQGLEEERQPHLELRLPAHENVRGGSYFN
jgi:transposase